MLNVQDDAKAHISSLWSKDACVGGIEWKSNNKRRNTWGSKLNEH